MNVCLQPSPTRFFFVNNYKISLEFDKIEFFRFELGRENGLISLLKLVTWLLLVKYAERRISLTSPVFMTIEIILHHITLTFVAFFAHRNNGNTQDIHYYASDIFMNNLFKLIIPFFRTFVIGVSMWHAHQAK